MAWMVIFFFASAAASSAYLTVSETFPLEIRALAIAFFYAVGTGVGGVIGPWLFGILIETGSRASVFAGYLLGVALMIAAPSWRPLGRRGRAQAARGGRHAAFPFGVMARPLPISERLRRRSTLPQVPAKLPLSSTRTDTRNWRKP